MFLPKEQMEALVHRLSELGYSVVGPRRMGDVISMQPVKHAAELAHGVRDEHDGGRYRLVEGDGDMFFEYVVGPDGPKRYLFPPQQRLVTLHIEGERFVMDAGPPQPPKLAFVGLRPCELEAIKVQDRVFGFNDPTTFRCESETYYCETRRNALLVVVNCTRPGGTCFCDSMGTGPQAKGGFDLALTELRAGFVMEVGSEKGQALAASLPVREVSPAELELADLKLQRARHSMGRQLPTKGMVDLLKRSIDHPRWDEVAKRCLSCGNCTMVCPTCFCSTVTDSTVLDDKHSTRTRQWESCFTHQFSYTTPGPVRNSIRGRYRHWMRHKLCTWWEQFGTSGCVGCGRCITWCPVGIDLTQEVAAIRGHDEQQSALSSPAQAASEVRT
jgi:ferredoxin